MKKCANCGFAETDDAKFCSSCGHNRFVFESESNHRSPHTVQAGAKQARPQSYDYEDMDKRPVGMAVLTFFLPFVGGYFLIKPDVNKGLRTFGIVWCVLFAVVMLAPNDAGSDYDAYMSIVTSALCIAPVIVYLIRKYRFEKSMQEADEEQRRREMLSMPLETFADKEIDDIAQKYQ